MKQGRHQRLFRRTLLAMLCVAGSAEASWVGDFVYCDVDGDGVYSPDAGDYGLDGVEVQVICYGASGDRCYGGRAPSGTLDFSTQYNYPGPFEQYCGDVATFDPNAPVEPGRYLFAPTVSDACRADFPLTCEVRVDPTTAPADCNVMAGPLAGGAPMDVDGDGALCSAVDGPFPEGQRLGGSVDVSLDDGGLCLSDPDPRPADAAYTTVIQSAEDFCALGLDFTFQPDAPPPPPPPVCALDLEISASAEVIEIPCEDEVQGRCRRHEPSCEPTLETEVTWTYTVVNHGDALEGLALEDPSLGVIAEGLSLDAGATLTLTTTEQAEASISRMVAVSGELSDGSLCGPASAEAIFDLDAPEPEPEPEPEPCEGHRDCDDHHDHDRGGCDRDHRHHSGCGHDRDRDHHRRHHHRRDRHDRDHHRRDRHDRGGHDRGHQHRAGCGHDDHGGHERDRGHSRGHSRNHRGHSRNDRGHSRNDRSHQHRAGCGHRR